MALLRSHPPLKLALLTVPSPRSSWYMGNWSPELFSSLSWPTERTNRKTTTSCSSNLLCVTYKLLFFKFFLLQLIYNVLSISDVQQSDPVLYIHSFSHIILHQVPSQVSRTYKFLENHLGPDLTQKIKSRIFFFFFAMAATCWNSWARDQTHATAVIWATAATMPDPEPLTTRELQKIHF